MNNNCSSKIVSSVVEFIEIIESIKKEWQDDATDIWFRGVSDDQNLLPKIFKYYDDYEKVETYVLQEFRRKASGFAETPPRGETDKWLFLAQHYGIPTRLLDWTESGLVALYFATNSRRKNPRVYVLNPHTLNKYAYKSIDNLNYSITWTRDKPGTEYIRLAWERPIPKCDKFERDIPIAVPAIFQADRMINQRSCFTIHGEKAKPLYEILEGNSLKISEILHEIKINTECIQTILESLAVLGITQSTIFPDLDNYAKDICTRVERFCKKN